MNNLTQAPAISQAPNPVLVSVYLVNDAINRPTGYRLKHGDFLGTVCESAVDAIEIDSVPSSNVRIPERHVLNRVIAEYQTQGAQLYAEGIGIEYCANCHITDGYRAAQLAEVA